MTDNVIDLKSVCELSGKNFFIPSYQRGYRWIGQQVKDLLDDIEEFRKNSNGVGFYCLQPLVVKEYRDSNDTLKTNLKQILENETSAEDFRQTLIDTINRSSKWEVIDGQQRLTTLCILLTYLTQESPYEIEYETRNGSADFLKNILTKTKTEADKNIDYHHMRIVREEIDSWFKDKEEKKDFDIKEYEETICNRVKFIWYESKKENPIKVFTRLNIGKISLTNAELIKALFLNTSNFDSSSEHYLRLRQMEIASEWDSIEFTLQNDEFWLFLKETGYERPTRIDFIFDIICEQNRLELTNEKLLSIGTDEYKTFRYFYEYFKSENAKIELCWRIVKDYYHTFLEWYNDLEVYHYVGYLIEYKYSLLTLLNQWSPLHKDDNSQSIEKRDVLPKNDKIGFVIWLKDKIKDVILNEYKTSNSLKETLEYQYKEDGSDKGKCKPILLFHNIQTIINQNKHNIENEKYKMGVFHKFPIHIYKQEKWDVEHINSNTTNAEDDERTQKQWLLNVYLSADKETQTKICDFFEQVNEDQRNKLFHEIKNHFPQTDDWTPEEKNRIWNYTLLDSSTNRSYGNALFSGKRQVIIGKDKGIKISIPKMTKDGSLQFIREEKAESSFVPICTKQVFMKYYSPIMSNANYWTKTVDAEGYVNDIKECINKLDC